jgi:hypothetical protein
VTALPFAAAAALVVLCVVLALRPGPAPRVASGRRLDARL